MPFVDLHGAVEAPKVEGWWDCTHRRFEPVLADLLPRGRAWDRDDPVQQQLVAGMATEYSRVDLRAQKLEREFNPETAFESLVDWETMLGLPDCEQPDTIDGRRKAILAKLLSQTGHDQSLGYWTEVFEKLGYTILWLNKGKPALTCIDDCNELLNDEEWLFVWEVAVESGDNDALLECVVQHQALIETLGLVHYCWQPAGPGAGTETLRGVACTMTGFVVAISIGAKFYRASSDLQTWTQEIPDPLADYYCICHGAMQGHRLIAAGQAGSVSISNDGGNTWAPIVAAAITGEVYGLSRGNLADDVVVGVGEDGKIYRSTNAGGTWVGVASPTIEYLYGVTRCAGAMVATGWNRTIIRSVNNGAAWTDVSPGGGTEVLYGVSAWLSTVVAVGASGVILRSVDAGATWVAVTSPTSNTLRGVTSSPSGRWTACGSGGVILQSLDDGVTWAEVSSPTTEDLYAACADWPNGRAIVVGDNRTIVLE